MADQDEDRTYRISDELWKQIEPLLPPKVTNSGRPRMDYQKAMEAILYVFRNGCKWRDVPRSSGAHGTVRKRFLEWRRTGVFQRMWQADLITYAELRTMFWNGDE